MRRASPTGPRPDRRCRRAKASRPRHFAPRRGCSRHPGPCPARASGRRARRCRARGVEPRRGGSTRLQGPCRGRPLRGGRTTGRFAWRMPRRVARRARSGRRRPPRAACAPRAAPGRGTRWTPGQPPARPRGRPPRRARRRPPAPWGGGWSCRSPPSRRWRGRRGRRRATRRARGLPVGVRPSCRQAPARVAPGQDPARPFGVPRSSCRRTRCAPVLLRRARRRLPWPCGPGATAPPGEGRAARRRVRRRRPAGWPT